MKKEINNPICQLNKLQELSEKISDLIYEGNLNQIKILDNERKRIINDFKKNYSPEFKEKLIHIVENNKVLIKKLQHKQEALTKSFHKRKLLIENYKY